MANPDFKKIVIKDALLQWPRLDQTYCYDPTKGGSEPVPQNARGANWSCGWLMAAEEARELWKELKEHYDECQKRSPTLRPFQTVHGHKKMDDGTVVFKAKKNGVAKSGAPNKAPELLAGDLTPLADRRIWTGSKGNVRVIAYPSSNPSTGESGISLLLDTIQLTKAVYGSDADGDDFAPVSMQTEKVETDTHDDRDEFGLPPIKQQQTAAMANELDDEIPF